MSKSVGIDPQQTQKNPLIPFGLLLTGLSIPFWILGAVVNTDGFPIRLPVSALMAFNPLIASLILTQKQHGRAGVTAFLRRCFDVRRIQLWYLPILFLMPTVMFVEYGLMIVMGRPISDPQISLFALPIMIAVFFVSAVGEEGGWQGFVYEPLAERSNPAVAALVLGSLWAVWHVIPYFQGQNTLAWIFWQCVTTVGLRGLIVWFYIKTHKSIFAAILFHTSINVSVFMFPNYGSYYDPFLTALLVGGVVIVLSLINRIDL